MTEICPGFELSWCLIGVFNPGKTAASRAADVDFGTVLESMTGVFLMEAGSGPDAVPAITEDCSNKPAAFLVPLASHVVKSAPETTDELLKPDDNAREETNFEVEGSQGRGVTAVNAAGGCGVSPVPGPAGYADSGGSFSAPAANRAAGDAGISHTRPAVPGAAGDAGVSHTRPAVPGAAGDAGISHIRPAVPGAAGDAGVSHIRPAVPAEIAPSPEPVLPAGDLLKPVDRLLVPGVQPAEVQPLREVSTESRSIGEVQLDLTATGNTARQSPTPAGSESKAVQGNAVVQMGETVQSGSGAGPADRDLVNATERSPVEAEKATQGAARAAPVGLPQARHSPVNVTTLIPDAGGVQKAVDNQSGVTPSPTPPRNPVSTTRGPAPELGGSNRDTVGSFNVTVTPFASERGTAVPESFAAGRGMQSAAEDAPHATPPPGRIGPAVLEAAPVQAKKGSTDHTFTGAELPRAVRDLAQVFAPPGPVLADSGGFGVGKIPLTELPRLLAQRIAHRLGGLEEHSGVIRIQLHLDPPELGSVAVRVALQGDELKVHFFANDTGVKETLTGAVPELRAELERIGLNLGGTYVSVDQEHGQGFGPQLHQWQTRFWSFEGDSLHSAETVIDEGINYLV